MDATCRIWSSRRGEQLFQINLPSHVNIIKVDYDDYLHFCCSNRLLTFKLTPTFKEADLPNYWQNSEIRKMIHQTVNKKVDGNPPKQESEEACMFRSNVAGIALSELKKLIAHGVVLPDTIDDMTMQYKEVDQKMLKKNMKKFNLTSQQVLKLVANSRFSPRDLLKALYA
jgi:hypothetical protein